MQKKAEKKSIHRADIQNSEGQRGMQKLKFMYEYANVSHGERERSWKCFLHCWLQISNDSQTQSLNDKVR